MRFEESIHWGPWSLHMETEAEAGTSSERNHGITNCPNRKKFQGTTKPANSLSDWGCFPQSRGRCMKCSSPNHGEDEPFQDSPPDGHTMLFLLSTPSFSVPTPKSPSLLSKPAWSGWPQALCTCRAKSPDNLQEEYTLLSHASTTPPLVTFLPINPCGLYQETHEAAHPGPYRSWRKQLGAE